MCNSAVGQFPPRPGNAPKPQACLLAEQVRAVEPIPLLFTSDGASPLGTTSRPEAMQAPTSSLQLWPNARQVWLWCCSRSHVLAHQTQGTQNLPHQGNGGLWGDRKHMARKLSGPHPGLPESGCLREGAEVFSRCDWT